MNHYKLIAHFGGELKPAGVQLVQADRYEIVAPGTSCGSWVRFYDEDSVLIVEFNADRVLAIFKINADEAWQIADQTAKMLEAQAANGSDPHVTEVQP